MKYFEASAKDNINVTEFFVAATKVADLNSEKIQQMYCNYIYYKTIVVY